MHLIEATPHELVVWKPAGLPSELPRDPSADSLISRLRADGLGELRLVHRLDAIACGLVLLARSREAAAHYSAEIAARRWHKIYVADVACPPKRAKALRGRHRAYLATSGRKAVVVRSGGKPSFLTIHGVFPVPDADGRSHVLIELETGRFHQIRAMLAAAGAPLSGDALYGGPSDLAFYLEHVVLGAVPFGDDGLKVWRAPRDVARPRWAPALADAVTAEAGRLSAT